MAVSVRQDTSDLARTPMAKLMLRLVKGMRLAMDLPDLLVSARWMEGGLKAMVTPSEATITRAVVVPRKR